MQQQIETLKREVDIHKEVEKELAKRSHFCQKVIKRLRQELKEWEESSKSKDKSKQKNPKNDSIADELKSAEELI